MVIEKTRNEIEDLKKEIIAMKLIEKEIESKTLVYDQDFSVLKADFETNMMNFQLMQRRMNDVPLRISDIEEQLESIKK
jgi:hypothetical protein